MRTLLKPAAVAEGGFLVKGYLWPLFHGVNTRYSLSLHQEKLKKDNEIIISLSNLKSQTKGGS